MAFRSFVTQYGIVIEWITLDIYYVILYNLVKDCLSFGWTIIPNESEVFLCFV